MRQHGEAYVAGTQQRQSTESTSYGQHVYQIWILSFTPSKNIFKNPKRNKLNEHGTPRDVLFRLITDWT